MSGEQERGKLQGASGNIFCTSCFAQLAYPEGTEKMKMPLRKMEVKQKSVEKKLNLSGELEYKSSEQ